MAGRIDIFKLLAPCLLILVALQLFGTKTSVSAESNLRDVYADYIQMDDGDYMEMDYFDERLDVSEIDRHGSKRRRFKLRNKHKQKKYNYGAPSYYLSPTPHKRPSDGKYGVQKSQSFVTPPKYRAQHRPPSRHHTAIPAASRPSGFRYPVSRPLAHRSPVPHFHASHSSVAQRPAAPRPAVSRPSASRPSASRPSASQLPTSRPTPSRPTPSRPTPSRPTPSRPTPSRPTPSRPTPSRPTPSRPTPSRPTPSRPSTPRPNAPRNATSSPKPPRSTPSSQTFSHFELPLLPLSHPVLFGPNGLRRQTSRPKVSKFPTKSSSSSLSTTSRPPTIRSSTVHPSTSQTSVSYTPTSTTLAPSTAVYSYPTSNTTTSSSTYSSTPTSSESTSSTNVTTTAIATEPSTPKAKKSQSKKKPTFSNSLKPENGPIKLTQEAPIKPDDPPKATSLSSVSVSNKDDTGYFFRPTDSFPNFFKQLLQG